MRRIDEDRRRDRVEIFGRFDGFEHLLRESVADPHDVVTNPDGANLREGVVSALSVRPKAPIAVLEVDEQVVPDMIRLGRPEVLVMLNFSRDQLDRHHEIFGNAILGSRLVVLWLDWRFI